MSALRFCQLGRLCLWEEKQSISKYVKVLINSGHLKLWVFSKKQMNFLSCFKTFHLSSKRLLQFWGSLSLVRLHTWGHVSPRCHMKPGGRGKQSDSHPGSCYLNDSCDAYPEDHSPRLGAFNHVLFAGECLHPHRIKYLGFSHWPSELKKPFGRETKHPAASF